MRRWRPRWAVVVSVLVIAALVSGLVFVLREPTPRRAWTLSLDRPATPVAAADAVAVVDAGREVLVVDRATGARRWAWRPGVSLTGALAYGGGTVYAGLRTGVCALAVGTGTPRWCVARGMVTRVFARPDVVIVVDGEQVTALAGATGSELWTRDTPDVGAPEIATDRDTLYLSGPRGLVAVDAGSGETRWRSAGDYRFAAHVYDGTVYVLRRDPATDRLEARFTGDGTLRYVSALGGRGAGGPVRSRTLVLVAGERGGRPWLQSFGTRTGERRWRKSLERVPGPPVAIGDLVALEHGGRLHLRDAARGEEWGGREEHVREAEMPVPIDGMVAFRVGPRVRAVRIDRSR